MVCFQIARQVPHLQGDSQFARQRETCRAGVSCALVPRQTTIFPNIVRDRLAITTHTCEPERGIPYEETTDLALTVFQTVLGQNDNVSMG